MQKWERTYSKLVGYPIAKVFYHSVFLSLPLIIAIFNYPHFLSLVKAETLPKFTSILLAQTSAEDFLRQGNNLYKQNRYEEALALIEKAIELNHNLPLAWNNRSRVLRELRRYGDAIYSSEAAIELDPNYGDAWFNRGRALMESIRYDKAIASFDKAIQIKPNDYEAIKSREEALNLAKVKPTFPTSLSPVIAERSIYPIFRVVSVSKISDVKPTDFYFKALRSLVEKYGIALTYQLDLQGNFFMGNELITRGEVVYMLATSFDALYNISSQASQGTSCSYNALESFDYIERNRLEPWYFPAYKKIALIMEKNLRYPDGDFQGNRALTRAELVVFLNSVADGYNTIFFTTVTNRKNKRHIFRSNNAVNVTSVTQLSDISPYDYNFDELQSLVERYGALSGYPDRTFKPDRVVTRGEFIVALNDILDKLNEITTSALEECQKVPN